jgi:serine/threonine protein kinase
MPDGQPDMRLDGSGSKPQEPDSESIRRVETEQASRSQPDPPTPSGDLSFTSRLASRQRSDDSQTASGSSYADLRSLGPSAVRTKLQELFEELRPETLAGPVSLIGLPTKIGEGGQFYVYRQEVVFLDRQTFDDSIVAVKRPVLSKTDSNPDAPIDLADPTVQESLGHIRNEIQALTNPKLRGHPNIVELLSWAFGEEWDRPFVLVLELAHEDLARALKRDDCPPDFMKMRFCSDIAKGLEAIHEAGFVHGDLKPANILVFRKATGFVAKLADFGFSVNEKDRAVGCTPAWQPPEVESSLLGDCFSYGLLIWSVLFLRGEVPPHSTNQSTKELALAHVNKHRGRYPGPVTDRIKTALSGLLEVERTLRSHRVDDFFVYATEPDHGGL